MYAQQYIDFIRELGFTEKGYAERTIRSSERRLKIDLPEAIRCFYITVAQMALYRKFNRILRPGEFYFKDDRLVFMEENQNVVFWGIPCDGIKNPDPVVHIANNFDPPEWFVEDCQFSVFIKVATVWQLINGGYRHCEERSVKKSDLPRLEKCLNFIAFDNGLYAFYTKNGVVGVVKNGKRYVATVAAKTTVDLDQIISYIDA